jgi:hypothetical protein
MSIDTVDVRDAAQCMSVSLRTRDWHRFVGGHGGGAYPFGRLSVAAAARGNEIRAGDGPGERELTEGGRGPKRASVALLRRCPLDLDHLWLRASFASPDLDPSRLGLRGYRYLDREHALFVAGLEPIGVKVLAEEHLALERPYGSLVRDDLVAFLPLVQSFGGHTEHVLLDGEIDRVRVDAREIEVQEDRILPPVSIHRDRSNLDDPSEGLLGEAVQIPERIEAHNHCVVTPWARTSLIIRG